VPRRRRNDPLGISDNPKLAIDGVRVAAQVGEIKRRLAYVQASYAFCKAQTAGLKSYNRSLARLKRAVGRPKRPGRTEYRLHPALEIRITQRARGLAGIEGSARLDPAHNQFVQQAAAEIAATASPIRGRPANACLRHHVEGLMALIQEACGTPVLALREKESIYDPQLAEGVSQCLRIVFSAVDPVVTTVQLVNIVRAARRKYAGKRMRFRDFFPFYGGNVDPTTLVPQPGPHHRLEHFEVAAPIYCP
jgi:hypothetical protein